ncbi:MAG: hypothetical protein ACKOC5_19690 [Chloroflexota bacterium]
MPEQPYPTEWHGQPAWALESAELRVVVVPGMGAKIVSMFDRRSAVEWLVGPGMRPFRPASYGAVFTEQDMSGWDEMFPTIVACPHPAPGAHHGAPLPDHGEVWALPWTMERAEGGVLAASVMGRALPYRLLRTLQISGPGELRLDYQAANLGSQPLPYLWAAHPQFAAGDAAQVIFPSQVTEVINVLPPEWGWGELEARHAWPQAGLAGGPALLDRIGPPALKRARKVFALPEARPAWAALVRRPAGDWLRMDWDPEQAPYLGLWVDEGALNSESVAAPEPMTGFYDSLATAYAREAVAWLAPGETHAWSLQIRFGSGPAAF